MKIEKKQLKEIEFLFDQSTKGLHLLFDDRDRLSKILQTPTQEKEFFNTDNLKIIQTLFTTLIAQKTFQEKKMYLDRLNQENFEILVRTYFHIVDNTFSTMGNLCH